MFKECWFSIQAIQMQPARIIIDDALRWRRPTGSEYDEWHARRFGLFHNRIAVAYPVRTQVGDDPWGEGWVPMTQLDAGVRVLVFFQTILRVPCNSPNDRPVRKHGGPVRSCINFWVCMRGARGGGICGVENCQHFFQEVPDFCGQEPLALHRGDVRQRSCQERDICQQYVAILV